MGIYHHITYQKNIKGSHTYDFGSKVIDRMPLYYLRDLRKNYPKYGWHIIYSKEITKDEYEGMKGKLD